MDFTVAVWKAAAKEKYAELATWLKAQGDAVGVMAYGGLTAFTLWPLVEYVSAAAQAGQPLPVQAILTMGSVAGGVGGNLLASQIQTWYERSKKGSAPTEADVLAWLGANALQKDEIQPALDQMLESLEAIPQAHEVIPAVDWQPFFNQLLANLQELGNLSRYEAALLGDGLLVQGEGNVVDYTENNFNQPGQTVHGHQVNAGSIRDIGRIGDDHHYETPPDPAQLDPAALREAYLSRVLAEHNRLLLGGIDPKAITADRERLRLSAVYTALLTESREGEHPAVEAMGRAELEKQARSLSAVELLNREGRLVLLGDPGSGKSTFVNFAAVCLAGEALGSEALNLALLTTPLPEEEDGRRRDEDEEPAAQPWNHQALLPVCITLREFAARGLPPAGQKGTADHLWRFLERELQAAALADYLPLLKKEMLEEGGIFMFDGLDEVPAADQHRRQIKQVVEDIAATYGKSRVLVTSRTYAYQKQDWRLPEFTETVLAPFSKGQIGFFVDRWYEQMAALSRFSEEDARGRAALLKNAVFSSKRLYELAERPLLLTLMASLHAWRGGSLPEKREELYADAVDLLLDEWEQQRMVRAADGTLLVVQPSLEQWLKADRDKVRGLLNRLAYEGHSGQADEVGTADIPGPDLVMGLLALSEDKSLQPGQLVEYISNRAGLLMPRGQDIYTFPHRTFQEYLAACHLTAANYPVTVAELARSAPNRWREVALLAGAKAAGGSPYALWGLVEELCCEAPGEGGEGAYWGAHLAGQLLCETADLSELTTAQTGHLDRVKQWLVHVLQDPVLPATERALAGRHLAQLGDPRSAVTDVDGMQFCLVPAGDFWMGDGDRLERVSFLNEDYWLARYPVTVAQYRAFVAEGGYANPDWWAEAITAGRWQEGAYDGRTGPYDWGPAFALDNQPVVGVSWFESLAFCRWLSARWQADGRLPHNWQVMLPSEAEWEKAARGGIEKPAQALPRGVQAIFHENEPRPSLEDNPSPRRPYTWLGDEISTEMANYEDSEINRSNAVGCYQTSVSVHGNEEMLGNVFEWTRSLYKDYPYAPEDGREVLQRGPYDDTAWRGGSWWHDEGWLRCGARDWAIPRRRDSFGGFRVALSPFDSGR